MIAAMHSLRSRRAIGLIEVIVCTMLVTVMLVPIAAVIRASGQSIAEAESDSSIEAELRRGLRWLGDAIRDGDVLSVRSNRIQLRTRSGEVGNVIVNRQTLEFQTGNQSIPIARDVLGVRFTEFRQSSAPKKRVGLSISLRARDPTTRISVVLRSTVSIPPQG